MSRPLRRSRLNQPKVLPVLNDDCVITVARKADALTMCRMKRVAKVWMTAILARENELWKEKALSNFPLLHKVLRARMATTEPDFRDIYRSQLLASTVPRCLPRNGNDHVKPTCKIDDFLFTVELSPLFDNPDGDGVYTWTGPGVLNTIQPSPHMPHRYSSLTLDILTGKREEWPQWLDFWIAPCDAGGEDEWLDDFWERFDAFDDDQSDPAPSVWETSLRIAVTHVPSCRTVKIYDDCVAAEQMEWSGPVEFEQCDELPTSPDGYALLFSDDGEPNDPRHPEPFCRIVTHPRTIPTVAPLLHLPSGNLELFFESHYDNTHGNTNQWSEAETLLYLEKGIPWEWRGGTAGVYAAPKRTWGECCSKCRR